MSVLPRPDEHDEEEEATDDEELQIPNEGA